MLGRKHGHAHLSPSLPSVRGSLSLKLMHETSQSALLFRYAEKHFATGTAEATGENFIFRRPPSFRPADNHDGARLQDRSQRFEAVPAQKDLYAGLDRALAGHYSKAVLGELHLDGRGLEGSEYGLHLRHDERDTRAAGCSPNCQLPSRRQSVDFTDVKTTEMLIFRLGFVRYG